MSKGIKFSIELTHSNGLWIENVCVYLLKHDSSRCALALESRESISEDFVTSGLAGDGWTDKHEAMTDYRGLVELDALLDESYIHQTITHDQVSHCVR